MMKWAKIGKLCSISLHPANRHDSKIIFDTLKQFLTIYTFSKLTVLYSDSAYDTKKIRTFCKSKNIVSLSAHNSRRSKIKTFYKPKCRWIVERSFAWISRFRSIRTCYAKTNLVIESFLLIASCFIDLRSL